MKTTIVAALIIFVSTTAHALMITTESNVLAGRADFIDSKFPDLTIRKPQSAWEQATNAVHKALAKLEETED